MYNVHCSEWSLKNMLLFLLFGKTKYFLAGMWYTKRLNENTWKIFVVSPTSLRDKLCFFFDFDIIWNCSSKKNQRKKKRKRLIDSGYERNRIVCICRNYAKQSTLVFLVIYLCKTCKLSLMILFEYECSELIIIARHRENSQKMSLI